MDTDEGKLVYGDQSEHRSVIIQGVCIEFHQSRQSQQSSRHWMHIIVDALVLDTEDEFGIDVVTDLNDTVDMLYFRWFEGRLQTKDDCRRSDETNRWRDVKEILKVAVAPA